MNDSLGEGRPAMPSASAEAPSVFISYARESSQHRAAVVEFAAFLRDQGVAVVLDAWFGGERQDWYAWALREISEADYVIVVASEKYRWITDGYGGNLQHKGVRSEAALLREMIYTDRDRWFPRCRPFLLPGHNNGKIPRSRNLSTAGSSPVTDFPVPGAEDCCASSCGDPPTWRRRWPPSHHFSPSCRTCPQCERHPSARA